jgi:hypothetical protein
MPYSRQRHNYPFFNTRKHVKVASGWSLWFWPAAQAAIRVLGQSRLATNRCRTWGKHMANVQHEDRDPIGPTSLWAMIVGCVFGGITLIGLFIFAFLASSNPAFVCNSFTLLAPVFALGAALSAGFIGGAAAAGGQLGDAAQTHQLKFSVGGGVAILFIAFFGFQQFKPACSGQSYIRSTLAYQLPGQILANDIDFKFAVKGRTREDAAVYSYDSSQFGKWLLFDSDVEVIQITVKNRPFYKRCSEDDSTIAILSRKPTYTTTYRIAFANEFQPVRANSLDEMRINFEYKPLVSREKIYDMLIIETRNIKIKKDDIHVTVSHSPDSCLSEDAPNLANQFWTTTEAITSTRFAMPQLLSVSTAHAAENDSELELIFKILGNADQSLVGKAQSALASQLSRQDSKGPYLEKIGRILAEPQTEPQLTINILEGLKSGGTNTYRLPNNLMERLFPLTYSPMPDLRRAVRNYLLDSSLADDEFVKLIQSYIAAKGPSLKLGNLEQYMLLSAVARDIYYNAGIRSVVDYRGNYGARPRKPAALADAKRYFATGIDQIILIPVERNVLFAKPYYGLVFALFSEIVMKDAEQKLGANATSQALDKYIMTQWEKANTPLPFSGSQRVDFMGTIDRFFNHISGRERDYLWEHHVRQLRSCQQNPVYNCFSSSANQSSSG